MVLHHLRRRNAPIFYPLEMPVQYTLENAVGGRGRTLEMNGEIVRFECDRTLPLGRNIQLVLSWPAILQCGAGLNLWIFGETTGVLCRDIEVAVARYEFRTRRVGKSPSPQRDPHDSSVEDRAELVLSKVESC
ncbi:MAG TPA: hypothetical protein VKT49_09465 [Bryobacteraceae bacterium]|nr:hypothetical protein [Bryobacteraceae bacterium]